MINQTIINRIASNLLDKRENAFKASGYYDKLMNAKNINEWKKVIRKILRDFHIIEVEDIIKRVAQRKMAYIKQRKHLRGDPYDFGDFVIGIISDEEPKVKYDEDDLMDDTLYVQRVVDMFGEEYIAQFRASGRDNGMAWN